MRTQISRSLRLQVMERAERRCEYCQCPEHFSLDTFQVDHVHPVSKGGLTTLDNLAYACNNCNSRKLDAITVADPETNDQISLFSPRIDDWPTHFYWSKDFLTIYPLTAIGRGTITRLHLNREGAMNIRRALLALGETHPPTSTLIPSV
jgi:hypothetical protein